MDTKQAARCELCWGTGQVLRCAVSDLTCRTCCSEDDCGHIDCPECAAQEILGAHLAEMIETVRRVA